MQWEYFEHVQEAISWKGKYADSLDKLALGTPESKVFRIRICHSLKGKSEPAKVIIESVSDQLHSWKRAASFAYSGSKQQFAGLDPRLSRSHFMNGPADQGNIPVCLRLAWSWLTN